MRVVFILTVALCLASAEDDGSSYSFHKFRGPVSGEIQQVVIPGHLRRDGHESLDYVAKPDYLYAYGVQDPETGNSQTHRETRDGDAVAGEYRVLQADGLVRVVKYTADGDNGFKATIEYENA